jgi:hypothetical protein
LTGKVNHCHGSNLRTIALSKKEAHMSPYDLFEEYKFFVDDMARFSERRQTVSNIYIAVQSLLLTAIGLLIGAIWEKDSWMFLLPIPLAAAGIFISLWWNQIIRKYKELVGLRIRALREMETRMPESVKMFHVEDEIYPRDANGKAIPGKGLNFSDHETRLPWLFLVLHALFGWVIVILLVTR